MSTIKEEIDYVAQISIDAIQEGGESELVEVLSAIAMNLVIRMVKITSEKDFQTVIEEMNEVSDNLKASLISNDAIKEAAKS